MIKITPVGNLGNQMLQLMLALSIQERVPGIAVVGYDLPAWNLRKPAPIDFPQNAIVLTGQHLDFEMLVWLLRRGILREVDLRALGFRLEHYLPRTVYQQLFPPMVNTQLRKTGDIILINVRGAETLGNCHPDYGPLPLAFYRQVIEATGLRPVFMGQIEQDRYSAALRHWFPDAAFVPSAGPRVDFDLIRGAKDVVVSISTFSWLAAWFSEATTIHMPVLGHFNPIQRPEISMLPVDDHRYRFYDFPVRNWDGSDGQFDALLEDRHFPLLSATTVKQRLAEGKRRIRRNAAHYRRSLLAHALIRRAFGIGGNVIMTLPSR